MGGGAAPVAPWTPAQLGASLRLWLDAGPTVTQAAGPVVSAWTDQTANGYNLAQAVGADRPGVGAINALACPDFAATDALVSTATLANLFGAASSAYYVAAVFDTSDVSAGGGTQPRDRAILVSSGAFWGLSVGGGLRVSHFDGSYKCTTHIAVSTGAVHLGEGWYDGVNVNCVLDNGTPATPVAAAALGAGGDANTMALGWGGAGFQYTGEIGALVVCNAVPSAPNRALLRAYLASRYAGAWT